jgi:hypothetical protein
MENSVRCVTEKIGKVEYTYHIIGKISKQALQDLSNAILRAERL